MFPSFLSYQVKITQIQVTQIYSDLFKFISKCQITLMLMFKKDQNKKSWQKNDSLINYLSKDYGYNKESANKVIEKCKGKCSKNCFV